MKKTTLFVLTMLLSLTSLAQTGETVTPPENLQVEEYALMTEKYTVEPMFTSIVMPLNIGTDGSNVYVQGLCPYMQQAWVKGTRSGNTVTFAKGQYFGTSSSDYGDYPLYFGGCDASWFNGATDLPLIDVVFTIDDATGTMTTETVLVVNANDSQVEAYDLFKDNVIKPAVDKAATPVTPTIVQFLPYDANAGYAGVSLDIPIVSTLGEPLLTSKLSYRIYTDTEKDIQPLVFHAENHMYLDEDMTEVPYTYDDDYDFNYGGYAAYFYHDTKDYNRIGVQAVYRGGGEEHASEIGWYDIKPYADESVTFDFNGMDKDTTPVSSSSSHAGDITSDKVMQQGDVTLTISPSGANTPNRFWVDYNLQAIQLRLYGGTLTFKVAEGKTIEKLYFNYGDWNDYNEFDCGEFSGNVWTGSAQQVVMTVYGDGGNTKLNSIAVVTKTNTESAIQDATARQSQTVRYFDLQGRELPSEAKGLVIRQVRTAEGHTHAVKVVR